MPTVTLKTLNLRQFGNVPYGNVTNLVFPSQPMPMAQRLTPIRLRRSLPAM